MSSSFAAASTATTQFATTTAASSAERRRRRRRRRDEKEEVIVWRIALRSNVLSGAIPSAMKPTPHLRTFQAGANHLSGWLPNAMGTWKQLQTLLIAKNGISGPIPDAVGSITPILHLRVEHNILSGFIPGAMGFMAKLREALSLSGNALSGPLPDAVRAWSTPNRMWFDSNKLSGLLPDAVASWRPVSRLYVDNNRLTGAIPDALPPSNHLLFLQMDHNQLAGSIPARLLAFNAWINLGSNKLRGIIDLPYAPFSFDVSQNQLAGPLPKDLHRAAFFVASANLFEGTVPYKFVRNLQVLCLSGQAGKTGGLTGPLPTSISRAQGLFLFAASHHRLEGVVPPLHATFEVLGLHNNLFKVLLETHFNSDSMSSGGVLMHNNLLSCHLPVMGNPSVGISLCGLGNQLSRPKHGFPAWVSPVERDKLLWIADKEVSFLVLKITSASTLAALASMCRFGGLKGLTSSMSGWRAQAGAHLWLALRCSQLLSSLASGALWRIFFLMLLLSWDLYKCPRSLALASAYMRDNTFTHSLVVVMWGCLGFHQSAALWLVVRREHRDADAKPKSGKNRRNPAMLYGLLTFILSLPAIMFQVGNSVPGSFGSGGLWVAAFITAFIGALQGLLGGLVLPRLAQKVTSHKHVYTTMANLLMSCVFPAAVIITLDTTCLGRWVAIWGPCVRNAEQFRMNHGWVEEVFHDITVMHPYEVCSPSYARGQTASMSHCVELTLLRLQDIWLGKLITSGLLIPAGRMSTDFGYKDQSEIVGKLAIILAYAIIASGHLPLMIPLLLLAMVSETLLGAMSWSSHQFRKFSSSGDGNSIATPSLVMAQVSTAIVHLIAASEDGLALAMVNVLLLGGKVCMNGVAEADKRKRSSQLPSELSEAVSDFSRARSPGDSSKAASEFSSSSPRRK